MNDTLNYNYYNNPSCCVKEALQEELNRINLINMEAGELNPVKARKDMAAPKKGDIDNNDVTNGLDIETLLYHLGTNS